MAKHRRTRDRSVTYRTLFSGGELAGVGIGAAGYEHRPGIEYDPAIAAVAASNGLPPLVADVLDIDPASLEPTDAAHFSPPCTRASTANQSAELNDDGTKEAPLDVAMGEWIARYIDVLAPPIVTVENVYAYRSFKAFGLVTAALTRQGYFWDYDHLNAADYGVPQTRRRLILRAVRGRLLPNLPPPEPWVGWYAAIEDLIPTLPASKFAKWQLERLPEGLMQMPGAWLVSGAQGDFTDGKTYATIRTEYEPAVTVAASETRRPTRAWLSAGRVVSMTPRALARFQSVPDWYVLSEQAGLACKVIGNGWPCLMAEKIYRGLRPG